MTRDFSASSKGLLEEDDIDSGASFSDRDITLPPSFSDVNNSFESLELASDDSKTPSSPTDIYIEDDFNFTDVLDAVCEGDLEKFTVLVNNEYCFLDTQIDCGNYNLSLFQFIFEEYGNNEQVFDRFFNALFDSLEVSCDKYLLENGKIDRNFRNILEYLVNIGDFDRLSRVCSENSFANNSFCDKLTFYLVRESLRLIRNNTQDESVFKIFDFVNGVTSGSDREKLITYFTKNTKDNYDGGLLKASIDENNPKTLLRLLDLIGLDAVRDFKVTGFIYCDDLMEYAVVRRNCGAIDILCERGWDLAKRYDSVQGGNILHVAVRQGGVNAVKSLIKNEPALAFRQNDKGVQLVNSILNERFGFEAFREAFSGDFSKLRSFAREVGFSDLKAFDLMVDSLNSDSDFSARDSDGKTLLEGLIEDYLSGYFHDESLNNFTYFTSLIFFRCSEIVKQEVMEKFPDILGSDSIEKVVLPQIERAIGDEKVIFTKGQFIRLLKFLDSSYQKEFDSLGEIYYRSPADITLSSNISCYASDVNAYENNIQDHQEKMNKFLYYAVMIFLNANLLLEKDGARGSFGMLSLVSDGHFSDILKENILNSIKFIKNNQSQIFLGFMNENCDLEFLTKLIRELTFKEGFAVNNEDDYKLAIGILDKIAQNEGDSVFQNSKGEALRMAIKISDSFPEFDIVLRQMGDENTLVRALKDHFGLSEVELNRGGRFPAQMASSGQLLADGNCVESLIARPRANKFTPSQLERQNGTSL